MARQFRLTFIVACALLVAVGCRKKEVLPARLGVENNYTAVRLLPFRVSAGVAAEAYQWVVDSVKVTADDATTQLALDAAAMRNSTISTCEKLECTFYTEGTYYMRCVATLRQGTVEKSFRVHVVTEFQSYKSWAKIVAYQPALGRNVWVQSQGGVDDLQKAINGANLNLRKGNKQPIYLGSYGGYAVFEFDHAVLNLKNRYDFQVLRDVENFAYGKADVVVWVSTDSHTWYRLQSQNDSIPYSGTYADGPNGAAVNGDATKFVSDDRYLWKMADGEVRIPVLKGATELVPKWIAKNLQSYRYDGFLLKKQCYMDKVYQEDASGGRVVVGYTQKSYTARAYNKPPEGEKPNFFGMDIDWAVDQQGVPVALNSIKFVKVATGVLEAPETIGLLEGSVTSVEDLNLK